MSDLPWGVKAAADFGVLGLMLMGMWMLYRLTDKWAERLVAGILAAGAAMTQQAEATAATAAAVKEGQSDQTEIRIAMGVLAQQIQSHGRYLEQIDRRLETMCARPARESG